MEEERTDAVIVTEPMAEPTGDSLAAPTEEEVDTSPPKPLHDQMMDYMAALSPSNTDIDTIAAVMAIVETAARSVWPDATAVLCGTHALGLSLPSSRLDIGITSPSFQGVSGVDGGCSIDPYVVENSGKAMPAPMKAAALVLLAELCEALKGSPAVAKDLVVCKGRIPLLKSRVFGKPVEEEGKAPPGPASRVSIFILEESGGSVVAVEQLQRVLKELPQLRPLCLVIKSMLREAGMTSFDGLVSNRLAILVAAFLQKQRAESAGADLSFDLTSMPTLSQLAASLALDGPAESLVLTAGPVSSFLKDLLQSGEALQNGDSLGQLLLSFLRSVGRAFDPTLVEDGRFRGSGADAGGKDGADMEVEMAVAPEQQPEANEVVKKMDFETALLLHLFYTSLARLEGRYPAASSATGGAGALEVPSVDQQDQEGAADAVMEQVADPDHLPRLDHIFDTKLARATERDAVNKWEGVAHGAFKRHMLAKRRLRRPLTTEEEEKWAEEQKKRSEPFSKAKAQKKEAHEARQKEQLERKIAKEAEKRENRLKNNERESAKRADDSMDVTTSNKRRKSEVVLTFAVLRKFAQEGLAHTSSLSAVQEMTAKLACVHPDYDVTLVPSDTCSEASVTVSVVCPLGEYKATGSGLGAKRAKIAAATALLQQLASLDDNGVPTITMAQPAAAAAAAAAAVAVVALAKKNKQVPAATQVTATPTIMVDESCVNFKTELNRLLVLLSKKVVGSTPPMKVIGPTYLTLPKTGKAAPPGCTVRASLATPDGTVYEEGHGQKVKQAEQDAARGLFERLGGIVHYSSTPQANTDNDCQAVNCTAAGGPYAAVQVPAEDPATADDRMNFKGALMRMLDLLRSKKAAGSKTATGSDEGIPAASWGLPTYETTDTGNPPTMRIYTTIASLSTPDSSQLNGRGTDKKKIRSEQSAAKDLFLQLGGMQAFDALIASTHKGHTSGPFSTTPDYVARLHGLSEQQGWVLEWNATKGPASAATPQGEPTTGTVDGEVLPATLMTISILGSGDAMELDSQVPAETTTTTTTAAPTTPIKEPRQPLQHTATVSLNGLQLATGVGASVKDAKQSAAGQVMALMVHGEPGRGFTTPSAGFKPENVEELCLKEFHRLADEALRAGALMSQQRSSTVSAILMQDGPRREPMVVSMGYGSGIYTGPWSKLNLDRGKIVTDSHAEVLARRGLMRYLYAQAELAVQLASSAATSAAQPPVFELVEGGQSGKVLRLRPGVRFHMYCSSIPCGDASCRKVPVKELYPQLPATTTATAASGGQQAGGAGAMHHHWPINCSFCCTSDGSAVPRKAGGSIKVPAGTAALAGLLQAVSVAPPASTGSTSGGGAKVGTEAVVASAAPAAATPEPRKSSCSDKIACWNVVGVQGALLGSMLLTPIYLSSITIGCEALQFSHGALSRAVCCRLAAEGGGLSLAEGGAAGEAQQDNRELAVEAPYHVAFPELYRSRLLDNQSIVPLLHRPSPKEGVAPLNECLNWNAADATYEVTLATTGSLPGYGPDLAAGFGAKHYSRLSKVAMSQRRGSLMGALPLVLGGGGDAASSTYRLAKDANLAYGKAKGQLRSHFENGHHNIRGACQRWLRRRTLAPDAESFPFMH